MTSRTMSFGGVDLGALLWVTSVERTVAPARMLTQTSVPGLDGGLATPDGLEPLELKVSGHLRASTVEDVAQARRALAAALMTDGPAALVLPDESDLYYLALYEGGGTVGRAAHKPEVELDFLATDPVAYGVEQSVPLSTSTSKLTVGGTWRTWPTVEATPAAGSSWTLTDMATGKHVTIEAALTGTQSVVVDMSLQRVTIDGSDWPVTLDSDFFSLATGSQAVKVSSGDGIMTWVERWV